jgi:hypothetical protein
LRKKENQTSRKTTTTPLHLKLLPKNDENIAGVLHLANTVKATTT